jgi:hypothetical protein
MLYTKSPLPLNGVVSVDGPPDLEADRAVEQSVCGGPVITQFVGGTPTEFPSRYREGSASGLLPIGTRQEIFVASTLGEQWITLFKQSIVSRRTGSPAFSAAATAPATLTGLTRKPRLGRRWWPAYNR